MPFMPEMLRFCGRRLRISARAHKTCDTVNKTGGVKVVKGAVHLEDARCDGSAHGGCQAACLLFWKEAWLRPVSAPGHGGSVEPRALDADHGRALPAEWSRHVDSESPSEEIRYRCQITELPSFTVPLAWWDLRQYAEDLTSGNIGVATLIRGARYALLRALIHLGVGYRVVVAVYNAYQRLRGRSSLPWVTGTLKQTPHEELNLQPGEWVRVKSFEEILATLDQNNRNRGLGFDIDEMRLHCKRTYSVDRRIERIINEQTGKMMTFGTSCVTLKGLYCTGETTQTRLFCPRAITPYWREIWLARLPDRDTPAGGRG
jgi:hypothetical protein